MGAFANAFVYYHEVSVLCITFIDRIQSIMTTRLVLNLVDAANLQDDSIYRSWTGIDPPQFATSSILGNIGAPVRTSSENVNNFSENDNERGSEGGPKY